jgi:CheY-like chemotaxis protein
MDDDPIVLGTLTDLLRAHGHRILEAPNGRVGLELARTERPELILVDYHMPEMDGLAVVAALKSETTTRGIPVVAFTSGTAAEANLLIRAGCIGFIPKPFEPGALPGLVDQFLRATVARGPRAPAPPRSRPATAF